MTRLSACYFCGTALDDPLDEYPVVPDALRGDDPDPTTVTLCSSCHEKLDAIQEVMAGAIDDAAVAESGHEGATASGGSSSDGEDVLVDPDPPVGSQGPILSDPDDDPAAETPAEETPAESQPASTGGADESGTVGDESDPTDHDSPPSDGDTQMPDSDAGPTDDSASASSDASPSTDAAEPSGQDEGDAPAESGAEDDSGDRSVVEGDHSISALEYNKVMRLLQNREFPVDREEIEVVAANAYQVARSDCATVIDVAVDRGLLEEVDGQLRKPDNA